MTHFAHTFYLIFSVLALLMPNNEGKGERKDRARRKELRMKNIHNFSEKPKPTLGLHMHISPQNNIHIPSPSIFTILSDNGVDMPMK